MIKDPRITVAAVVERDGRFLMVEEVCNGAVVFNQPAGHVEENESFIDAVVRETLEETGWEVSVAAFLGVYVLPMPKNGFTYYRFCYAADAIEKVEQQLDKEIVSEHWLTYEEIADRKSQLRSDLVLTCIDDFRKGIRLPLDCVKEFGDRNT